MASLRGRYIIDRVKNLFEPRFRLPCPPYGKPEFWDNVYNRMGPTDVFEWGNCSFADFVQYDYQLLSHPSVTTRQNHDENKVIATTTIEETILPPKSVLFANEFEYQEEEEETKDNDDNTSRQPPPQQQPIILIGCGNSKFGEDMIVHDGTLWKKDRSVLIQVDISARVLDGLAQRCKYEIERGDMALVHDDATELSTLVNANIQAISAFDKGLMDALFCASEYSQIEKMMQSIHNVLCPGGIFCFLSFSRPEFLMDKILPSQEQGDARIITTKPPEWQNVQIRQLEQILLYRFQKAMHDNNNDGSMIIKSPNKKVQRKK